MEGEVQDSTGTVSKETWSSEGLLTEAASWLRPYFTHSNYLLSLPS